MPNELTFNSRLMKLYTVTYWRRTSLTATETVERCYRTRQQAVNDVKELINNAFVTAIRVTDNFGNCVDFTPQNRNDDLTTVVNEILAEGTDKKKRQQKIYKLRPEIRQKVERMLDEPSRKAMRDVWSWVDEHNAKPDVNNFTDRDHQLAARKIRNMLMKIEAVTGKSQNHLGSGNDTVHNFSSGEGATTTTSGGHNYIENYSSKAKITFSVGDDEIYNKSTGRGVSISAGDDNNYIENDSSAPTIIAGFGNDTIFNKDSNNIKQRR